MLKILLLVYGAPEKSKVDLSIKWRGAPEACWLGAAYGSIKNLYWLIYKIYPLQDLPSSLNYSGQRIALGSRLLFSVRIN